MLTQYRPRGRNASEISSDVETALREGRAAPGVALPAVRELAAELGLSPVTVASAYRELREKGIARGNGRAGTRITGAPPVGPRPPLAVPAGVRNLLAGSPDPAFLPDLPAVTPPPRAYADPPVIPRLRRLAAERLRADGIDARHLAVVGGALDGVERVLQAWLRPGDRVAIEDPGYPPVLDLLTAMNLGARPVAVDEFGVVPGALADALDHGCQAVLLTPRAQAPTGAAWDPGRTGELAALLAARAGVGIIEDDHAGPVSGAAARSVAGATGRWATIRSVSKSLGPDLRLAVLAGDAATIARVEGRQALGAGWVSGVLQEIVAELWADSAVGRLLARAAAAYAQRRGDLIEALAGREVPALGRSGLAVWVPVPDEPAVTSALLERGWAVAPGARFRIASAPAIRIGTAALASQEASRLAADLADCLARGPRRSD